MPFPVHSLLQRAPLFGKGGGLVIKDRFQLFDLQMLILYAAVQKETGVSTVDTQSGFPFRAEYSRIC